MKHSLSILAAASTLVACASDPNASRAERAEEKVYRTDSNIGRRVTPTPDRTRVLDREALERRVPRRLLMIRSIRRLVATIAMLATSAAFAAPFAYIPNNTTQNVSDNVLVSDLAGNTTISVPTAATNPVSVVAIQKVHRYFVVTPLVVEVRRAADNAVEATLTPSTVGAAGQITAVAADTLRGQVHIGTLAGFIATIDAETLELQPNPPRFGNGSLGLSMSADNSRLFVSHSPGAGVRDVSMLDAATRQVLRTLRLVSEDQVLDMAAAHDGHKLFLARNNMSSENPITVIDFSTSTPVEFTSFTIPATVQAIRANLDGTRILVSTGAHATSLYSFSVADPLNGPTIHLLGELSGVTGIDFTPDGREMVIVQRGGIARFDAVTLALRGQNVFPEQAGFSLPSHRFVMAPPSFPDSPTIVSAVPGDGSARIAFAPAATGGAAASFEVTCRNLLTTVVATANGTASPITVAGLTNNHTYSCTMTASNAVGASGASNAVNVTPRAVRSTRDVDASRTSDIFWTHEDGGLAVWLMDGLQPVGSGVLMDGSSGWRMVETKDFNGDGAADVLWRNDDGSVAIWLMNGAGPFDSAIILGPGSGWRPVKLSGFSTFSDFNGDGSADILWRHDDGSVALWLMQGLQPIGSTVVLGPGTEWPLVMAADLNGDAKADLVWSSTDGRTAAWLMDGLTATASAILLDADNPWLVVNVADFNGDGRSDFLLRDKATGLSAGILLMDGLSITGSTVLLGDGPFTVAQLADFNGDGRTDLLLSARDGRVAIWLMDGAGVLESALVYGGQDAWQVLRLDDHNGDGLADILWSDANNRVAIWLMNGTTPTAGALIFGGGGWRPTP